MATIQGVYLALFGRPADPIGLQFFNNVSSNGANLSAIGDIAGTAEYMARFTGQTNAEIVNSIYVSLFGRDADQTGLDHFVGEMEAGRQNINTIAINIMDGAQNEDLVVVNNKLVASDLFTSHLNLDAEVQAYAGAFASETGRDFLDGITADASTIPDSEVTDQQILFLFRDGNAPTEMAVTGMAPDHQPIV